MCFKSQAGQDRWICELFSYKKNGYFIDIGAFDGIAFSNTYYLEKELDWTGICIEAGKKNFESLMKNRTCSCLNYAIYNENKPVMFKENGMYGLVEENGEQSIEAITMEKLMMLYKAPSSIDYISLDIEGSEFEALEKFPFDKYKVSAWTIEHNSHVDFGALKMKVREVMLNNGYVLVPDDIKTCSWEDWYINSEFVKV